VSQCTRSAAYADAELDIAGQCGKTLRDRELRTPCGRLYAADNLPFNVARGTPGTERTRELRLKCFTHATRFETPARGSRLRDDLRHRVVLGSVDFISELQPAGGSEAAAPVLRLALPRRSLGWFSFVRFRLVRCAPARSLCRSRANATEEPLRGSRSMISLGKPKVREGGRLCGTTQWVTAPIGRVQWVCVGTHLNH
jgi:hypothetical protein